MKGVSIGEWTPPRMLRNPQLCFHKHVCLCISVCVTDLCALMNSPLELNCVWQCIECIQLNYSFICFEPMTARQTVTQELKLI